MSQNKLYFFVLVLAVFGIVGLRPTQAQSEEIKERIKKLGISPVTFRPQLKIDYSKVSELIALSRKKEYYSGEMISIDINLLNNSKDPVYFRDLVRFAEIYVQDSEGKIIPVDLSANIDFFLSDESFTLLAGGEYAAAHISFFLGCNSEGDRSFIVKRGELFEKKPFISYGRGCIKIKKDGKYKIKAYISNDIVVTKNESYKTAAGTLESAAFEIIVK